MVMHCLQCSTVYGLVLYCDYDGDDDVCVCVCVCVRARASVLFMYVYDTDMRLLTSGICSEKRVVRRFRLCAKVIECTYTNLDSTV